MNKKEMKLQEQPYEKFLRFGAGSLTEAELLAIVLRTGTKEKTAVDMAREVLALSKYPKTGLLGLYDLSLQDLMRVKGIGLVKAVKLKSLTELSMRFSRATAEKGLLINKPETIAKYFMEKLRHLQTECVYLVCLDAKGQILAEKKLSDGSVNMALISPREVFLSALEAAAVNVILLHNHPSGDPTPSNADSRLTERVWAAGKELGIKLLDHIIIGDNSFFSFCNSGFLISDE